MAESSKWTRIKEHFGISKRYNPRVPQSPLGSGVGEGIDDAAESGINNNEASHLKEANTVDRGTPSAMTTSTPSAAEPSIPRLGLHQEYESPRGGIFDIILVHGPNGHRRESFTSGGQFWPTARLAPFLEKHDCRARIFTYGYSATINDEDMQISVKNIWDRGVEFMQTVSRYRSLEGTDHYPLMIIADTLGGLLVKSALIRSYVANRDDLPEFKSMINTIIAVVYAGTPHIFSEGLKLTEIFTNIQTVLSVSQLQLVIPNSETLQDMMRQYTPIASYFKTIYIREGRRSVGGSLVNADLIVPPFVAFMTSQDVVNLCFAKGYLDLLRFTDDDNDFNLLAMEIVAAYRNSKYRNKAAERARVWEIEVRGTNPTRVIYPKATSPSVCIDEVPSPFISRPKEWKKLRLALLSPEKRIVILSAAGGVGKTFLIQEYLCKVAWEQTFSEAYWIDAINERKMHTDIAKILREKKIDYGFSPLKTFMNHLFEEKGESTVRTSQSGKFGKQPLVIYDNVDNVKKFHLFNNPAWAKNRPFTACIITRDTHKDLDRCGTVVCLGRFTQQESVALLRQRNTINLRQVDGYCDQDLEKLSFDLGYLPLALGVVKKIIDNSDSRQFKLPQCLSRNLGTVTSYSDFDDNYWAEKGQQAVQKIWEIGIKKLLRKYKPFDKSASSNNRNIGNINCFAAFLLHILIFLDTEHICEKLLTRVRKIREQEIFSRLQLDIGAFGDAHSTAYLDDYNEYPKHENTRFSIALQHLEINGFLEAIPAQDKDECQSYRIHRSLCEWLKSTFDSETTKRRFQSAAFAVAFESIPFGNVTKIKEHIAQDEPVELQFDGYLLDGDSCLLSHYETVTLVNMPDDQNEWVPPLEPGQDVQVETYLDVFGAFAIMLSAQGRLVTGREVCKKLASYDRSGGCDKRGQGRKSSASASSLLVHINRAKINYIDALLYCDEWERPQKECEAMLKHLGDLTETQQITLRIQHIIAILTEYQKKETMMSLRDGSLPTNLQGLDIHSKKLSEVEQNIKEVKNWCNDFHSQKENRTFGGKIKHHPRWLHICGCEMELHKIRGNLMDFSKLVKVYADMKPQFESHDVAGFPTLYYQNLIPVLVRIGEIYFYQALSLKTSKIQAFLWKKVWKLTSGLPLEGFDDPEACKWLCIDRYDLAYNYAKQYFPAENLLIASTLRSLAISAFTLGGFKTALKHCNVYIKSVANDVARIRREARSWSPFLLEEIKLLHLRSRCHLVHGHLYGIDFDKIQESQMLQDDQRITIAGDRECEPYGPTSLISAHRSNDGRQMIGLELLEKDRIILDKDFERVENSLKDEEKEKWKSVLESYVYQLQEVDTVIRHLCEVYASKEAKEKKMQLEAHKSYALTLPCF